MSQQQGKLSLKTRALRHLAAREHSRAELERKLAGHVSADDPGELTRALDELTAKGFINEQRVAESVLHRRAGKLGAARILQELRAKALSDNTLRAAADALRASELERARAVWHKKFGAPPQDATGRARQLRFLAARGFSAEIARRVVGGDDC
ncbi:MAG: recombination regulator RecX [Burkholderiaceae bacterium]|nr:recombination regulator RecX [Burkholderiaceae bacterium]